MSKEPRTYPELIKAIGADITPRIVKALCREASYRNIPIPPLTEAVDQALHSGKTLELISEFVGYRHVELLERHAKEQRDNKAIIWRARLTARIKDLEKEKRDLSFLLRKEQER